MGNESNNMISKEDACPGRDKAEKVSNKHYVLGNPYKPPFPDGLQMAVFATGCYWGTEKGYWRMPSVYSTAIGYAGGYTPNPTYQEVCSGRTGHTEAVIVIYDPSKISYSDLLRLFYESHNPSQYMGQGNDRGSQYRSAIYTFTADQDKLARASKISYEKALSKEIHTEIRTMDEVGSFYYAHEGYQQYLARPNSRPYCSAQPQGVSLDPYESWVPDGLDEDHSPKLSEEYWEEYAPRQGCLIGSVPNDQIVWEKSTTKTTKTTTTTTTTTTMTTTSGETTKGKKKIVLVDAINDNIMGKSGTKLDVATFLERCDYICLYFSAHRCSSCVTFTPKLVTYYNLHYESKKFDIIFVSHDQDQNTFNKYYGSMPWKALVYSERDKALDISSEYNVTSLPALVILDAGTCEVVCADACRSIVDDVNGTYFPYKS